LPLLWVRTVSKIVHNKTNHKASLRRSDDIAAATRPKVKGHISGFCLKMESIARGTL